MTNRYKLLGKLAVPCPDLMEWAKWMEIPNIRRVAETQVGCLWVSTVFLGLDHNYVRGGLPILFETMIFGLEDDEYQTRCGAWTEAEHHHRIAVQHAKDLVAKADAVLNKKADQEDPGRL